MNQRTAKLLNRFASKIGANYKELRRNWQDLNQKERAKRRNEMQVVLKRAEKSGKETAAQ